MTYRAHRDIVDFAVYSLRGIVYVLSGVNMRWHFILPPFEPILPQGEKESKTGKVERGIKSQSVRETLEKQLQLLSERSQTADNAELCELTAAMAVLISAPWPAGE